MGRRKGPKSGRPPSGIESQTGFGAVLGRANFVLVEVSILLIVCGSGCICVVFVRVLEVSVGL